MSDLITIGLPSKGRLKEKSLSFFSDSGLKIIQSDKERNYLLKKIEEISKNTAISHNCETVFKITPGYPPTINDKHCAEQVRKIFKKTFGEHTVDMEHSATMGSEDFSYMLKKRPGAYVWLGCGEKSEKLHSPYYDFNDKLLPIGAKYWTNLVENLMP